MVMELWEWIVLIIALFIVLLFVFTIGYYYNRIIMRSNQIDNAWAQIDVQLKKRADLVPNLVETVKGYMKHEREVMDRVVKARERMLKASGQKEKMEAGNILASALKTIFALAENYPNLKASENFKLLQEQLEGIENKIAYSRQFYNDSALSYNNTISTLPGRWFAKMMGRRQQKPYLEIPEAERAPIKVSF